ncbi:MAG: hypothetical protein DRJ56_08235 [Thermoprotei archaeon]|nr:MAG: hypothetical protein DRJ56_08235 [Thermoprotei archaeon]
MLARRECMSSQRMLAYVKVSIRDAKSWLREAEGGRAFLKVGSLRIDRVRLAGFVDRVYEYKNRVELVLTDGSGELVVKVWSEKLGMVDGVNRGSAIEVFGVLRRYRDVTYVSPDIIRPVSGDVVRLRALEAKLVRELLSNTDKLKSASLAEGDLGAQEEAQPG